MNKVASVLMPLFAALTLAVLPAQAQESVQVRGWAKASHGRIVFDWPRPVEYTVSLKGSELTVRFDRAMRADLNIAVRGLSDYVTGARLSSDGRTASFSLSGSYKLESFASGSSVIVDLRRKKTTAKALAPAGQPEAKGLQVRVGHHPGFTRLVFDWGESVDYTIARDGRGVSMRFDRPGTFDMERLDKALPKPAFGSPTSHSAGGDLVVGLTVPEQSFIRHFRDGGKVVLDVQGWGGDFGGAIADEATEGRMMETISPTGEVVAVPAMVGSTVAVAPGGQIPLVTEDVVNVPAEAVPYQGSYTPLSHYDPNATGRPKDLLRYGKPPSPANVNGG